MGKVNAVIKASKILKLLAKAKGQTLSEISEKLDIPKSSTHDILSTLKSEGLIKYDNEQLRSYSLGVGIYELGTAYLSQLSLTSLVKPYLEILMNTYHTTAFLAVEDQGEIVYLDKAEPLTFYRTTLSLGSRNGMYHTGLGKALLATYTRKRIEQIVGKKDLKSKTKQTIINFDELINEMQRINERGYAIDDKEDNENTVCVAAPIRNNNEEGIAAISVSFLSNEISAHDLNLAGEDVAKAALEVSKKLGFIREKLYF